ncbi:MAG TPA: hypothetical protein VGB64_13075 [Actinomycetota bacterium]
MSKETAPRRVSLVVAGLAAGALLFGGVFGAGATHQPADKVVAAGSTLEVMGPNAEVTILSATLRSSSPSDLVLSVTLECSIFTRLLTGPSDNGGVSTATAAGTVLAWIEVDGQIVPVNSSTAGSDRDKVTFCNRTYSRTVTDAEDPLDGQDIEEDFIDTKAANSFNWVHLNVGSGIHEITVKATLAQETTGDATAEAAIGNRTLVVQPSKLANDATI